MTAIYSRIQENFKILYSVPFSVHGKFAIGYNIKPLVFTNHKIPVTRTGTEYGIRSSPEFHCTRSSEVTNALF